MRWDTSPECRTLIDRNNAAMLRGQEERARHPEWREQDIRVNEYWHEQNLNMLEQCVAYARAREHYYEFLATLHCYQTQEAQRLQERASLMKRYNVERLPHQHKAREKALNAELVALLSKKEQIMIEEIPYDEGMALYYRIKRRYDQLFRALAEL